MSATIFWSLQNVSTTCRFVAQCQHRVSDNFLLSVRCQHRIRSVSPVFVRRQDCPWSVSIVSECQHCVRTTCELSAPTPVTICRRQHRVSTPCRLSAQHKHQFVVLAQRQYHQYSVSTPSAPPVHCQHSVSKTLQCQSTCQHSVSTACTCNQCSSLHLKGQVTSLYLLVSDFSLCFSVFTAVSVAVRVVTAPKVKVQIITKTYTQTGMADNAPKRQRTLPVR